MAEFLEASFGGESQKIYMKLMLYYMVTITIIFFHTHSLPSEFAWLTLGLQFEFKCDRQTYKEYTLRALKFRDPD